MPAVKVDFKGPIQVVNADCELKVAGVGTLIFSKGSVEWKPLGASKNVRRYTWAQLGKHLAGGGQPAVIQEDGQIVRKTATERASAASPSRPGSTKAPAKRARPQATPTPPVPWPYPAKRKAATRS